MASDNEIYYFEIGRGEWTGEFLFDVTDWNQFWKAKISLKHRLLTLAMALTTRLFKHAVFHSRITASPEAGEAGIASNSIRLYRFGITLFISSEDYVLHRDGSGVTVKAQERFGPVPFLFREYVEYPATIHEGGMSSTYYLPMLDSQWIARYQVRADRNGVHGVLECAWGRAEEIMNRIA